MISLNIEKTFGFISKEKVFAYEAEVKAAQEMLEKGTGKGNDFLGWLHLPSSITKEHLADLNATAKVLRDNCEVVIFADIVSCIDHDRSCFLFLQPSEAVRQSFDDGTGTQIATTDTGYDYYFTIVS